MGISVAKSRTVRTITVEPSACSLLSLVAVRSFLLVSAALLAWALKAMRLFLGDRVMARAGPRVRCSLLVRSGRRVILSDPVPVGIDPIGGSRTVYSGGERNCRRIAELSARNRSFRLATGVCRIHPVDHDLMNMHAQGPESRGAPQTTHPQQLFIFDRPRRIE